MTELYDGPYKTYKHYDGSYVDFYREYYDSEKTKIMIEAKYAEWIIDGEDAVLHGPYKEWYYNGNLNKECVYKYGYKKGIVKKYHEDGELWKQYTYRKCTDAHDYSDYLLDGKYIEYYPDGSIESEVEYKSGSRVGKYIKYYSDGTTYIECDYDYYNRKPEWRKQLHGRYTEYYPNGNIKYKGFYLDGAKHDERTKYDISGKKLHKNCYEFGLKDGLQYYYDKNGRKQCDYHYIRGYGDRA